MNENTENETEAQELSEPNQMSPPAGGKPRWYHDFRY
jgi:hypothetical protein